MDMTMGAYGVIGKAKTPLDDTTMSMKWEVFGWPQKVSLACCSCVLSLLAFLPQLRFPCRACAVSQGVYTAAGRHRRAGCIEEDLG